MAITIKNAEAERLARELAARTGESLTGAILAALRERHERLSARRADEEVVAKADEIRSIARKIGPLPEPWRSTDHGELLYVDG